MKSTIWKDLEKEIEKREGLDLAFIACNSQDVPITDIRTLEQRWKHFQKCRSSNDREAYRKAAISLIVALGYTAWSAEQELTNPQLLMPFDEGYEEAQASESANAEEDADDDSDDTDDDAAADERAGQEASLAAV